MGLVSTKSYLCKTKVMNLVEKYVSSTALAHFHLTKRAKQEVCLDVAAVAPAQ